mgnify:CR=1 FL=1
MKRHISHGKQAKQMGLDVNFLKGAAVFTGKHNTGALIADITGHRWMKRGSKHLDVVCTAEKPPPAPITFHRHKLVRVRVKGQISMTSR